jgi:hypothetical protein
MPKRDLTPLLSAFLAVAAAGTIVTVADKADAVVIIVCDEDGFCQADDPDKPNPPPPPPEEPPPPPPPDPGPIVIPPVDVPDIPDIPDFPF